MEQPDRPKQEESDKPNPTVTPPTTHGSPQPSPSVTHGNLTPTPEVAPANDGKNENKESNVTVPENKDQFVIKPQPDLEHSGRDMAVIGPKDSAV